MEKFPIRRTEHSDSSENNEGIKPVGLTLKATIAALSIVSATPAFAEQQRAPLDQSSQTIVIDVNALKQMANRIQMQIKSPETKAVAAQAVNEAAQIGTAAAVEIAKPMLDELISGLAEFRKGLDGKNDK